MALPFADEFKDGTWNFAFFDTVGDESGSVDMNVDGSVTPVDFKITAPAGKTYYIHRLAGIVVDLGDFDAFTFGALPQLTNGLHLYQLSGGVYRLMTNQHPIQHNMAFAAYAHDVHILGANEFPTGTGDTGLTWSHNIAADGAPFKLVSGDSLVFRVADDLTGLRGMHCRAGMVAVPNTYI